MGKGKRLRGLRASAIIMDEAPEEKTIRSMRDLNTKGYHLSPIGGKSRWQRRKEERMRIADRDRVIRGPRITERDSKVTAARVLRKTLGEAESIKKAREIDPRARRATMEVK